MTKPKGSNLMNGNKTNKGQGFDKNKDNINKKGRPRRGIALINLELEEKGYIAATRQDIETNYMHLMNLTKKELAVIAKDNTRPMLIVILAKNILGFKGFDVVERMLDRGIGKSVQRSEERNVDKDGNDIIIKLPE